MSNVLPRLVDGAKGTVVQRQRIPERSFVFLAVGLVRDIVNQTSDSLIRGPFLSKGIISMSTPRWINRVSIRSIQAWLRRPCSCFPDVTCTSGAGRHPDSSAQAEGSA
ncbi:hypothetical protein CHELA1G11_11105 [Hyphomicrobiales bacterium]|nr:hypothetical protein CHELA1G11_11105 [Hyphomicrobiales bacterium]CAH1670087.1 hypothetical protein CHELA1G2_13203 [Hyphomicrobiales bacterium]